jgi:hypothetical protein
MHGAWPLAEAQFVGEGGKCLGEYAHRRIDGVVQEAGQAVHAVAAQHARAQQDGAWPPMHDTLFNEGLPCLVVFFSASMLAFLMLALMQELQQATTACTGA